MLLRLLSWLTGLGPNTLSSALAHAAAQGMCRDYETELSNED